MNILKSIIIGLVLVKFSRSFQKTSKSPLRLINRLKSSMATADNNPLLEDWTANEFALPPFARIEAKHFRSAFDASMLSHMADLQAIVDDPSPASFANVCETYDRAGGDLTKIASLFSNLCSSCNTEPLQEVQTEMAPLLAGHDSKVYTLPGLFDKIDAVYNIRENAGLTSEQVRLVERIHLDFCRHGMYTLSRGSCSLRGPYVLNHDMAIITQTSYSYHFFFL